MATYYVYSGATGSATGADWTNAFTTLAAGVAAVTSSGDVIKVHKGHAEAITVDTSYNFTANGNIICVDKDSSDALAQMNGTTEYVGHTSSNRSVIFGGAFKVYHYGMCYLVSGSASDNIVMCSGDGGHSELEKCHLKLANTNGSSGIFLGDVTDRREAHVKAVDCTFTFGASGQGLYTSNSVEIVGGSVAGTAPATLFKSNTNLSGGMTVNVIGFDMSIVTGTLVGDWAGATPRYSFIQSKLGSGVVVMAAQTRANKSSASATIYDCAAGDQHYHFQYHDAFGSLTTDTGIYANDGITYDGTNRCSWKIVTTANCSYYTPFVTPWLSQYNSATASVTPSIEIAVSGSSTALNDDEVWAELAAKTTSGVPLGSIYRDRCSITGTAAAQPTGIGTSNWTGLGGTAWSGKVDSGSAFTPAEIGDISARIVVGKASTTLYADTQIRGL